MRLFLAASIKIVGRRFRFLLSLFLFAGFVACVTTESLAQELASEDGVADTLVWQEVLPSDVMSVVQLLSAHTKSNYEKIRTWQGVIHRKSSLDLSESQAASIKAGSADTPMREVHQETLHFAVDLSGNKRFVSEENSQVSWVNRETGDPIQVDDRSVSDECFIVTARDCVRFDSSKGPASYIVVRDHPSAQHKRAAFREPRESDNAVTYVSSGDPRRYFGIGSKMKFWESLDLYVESLNGKGRRGPEGPKLLRERLKFYQAAGPGGRWYREDMLLEGPGGQGFLFLRTVWSPEAGLYPIKFNSWLDGPDGTPLESIQWTFESVDDIWIPTLFHKKRYVDGDVGREESSTIADSVINKPIPSSQFEYSASGLKDGDLVMDRIENVCYIMKDGEPEKLADFDEKYIPPGERRSSGRWLLIAVGGVLLLVVLALFRFRRAKA